MNHNPFESPAGVAHRRGGARRILGWMVGGVGAALTLRIAWILATWGNKSEAEWNRIYVLGTLGIVLLVAGSGLLASAKFASKSNLSDPID